MKMVPPSLATTTTSSSSISTVHPDIIQTHILTRLDASALASASCVSSQLYSLITSNETIWTNICNSTWPSTNTPRLRHVISSFPNGPRSFFSDSFTNPDIATTSSSLINLDCPSELISAVDIYYQKRHIFGKVVETETFDCSPFRVDLLDPKDSVTTGIPHQVNEDMSRELGECLALSWILIDPIGRRAMNLSSYKPVAVERWSLSTGEVHVHYGWIFYAGEEGSTTEYVKCGISVTCEGSQSGEMNVSKVSLDLEDMYGKQLSGKDSLVTLLKGMEGKRGNVKGREEDGKRRYEEYMEKKRERDESHETTSEIRYVVCGFWGNDICFFRVICFQEIHFSLVVNLIYGNIDLGTTQEKSKMWETCMFSLLYFNIRSDISQVQCI